MKQNSLNLKEHANGKQPESPFAKYAGFLQLGNKGVECYVLDTDQRVISMRASVKAITNTDGGNLASYVGVKALQPYFSNENLQSSIIEFSIPGSPFKSKGITAETFLDICSAYVSAMSDPKIQLTQKQQEIEIGRASCRERV